MQRLQGLLLALEFLQQVGLQVSAARDLENFKYRKQGDVMLVLGDIVLDKRIEQLQDNIDAGRLRLAAAISRDPLARAVIEAELAYLQKELDDSLRRREEMVIRAPRDGQAVLPEVKNLVGTFLTPRQPIGEVASMDKLRVITQVDQRDAGLSYKIIAAGVDVRLVSAPASNLRGQVEELQKGKNGKQ